MGKSMTWSRINEAGIGDLTGGRIGLTPYFLNRNMSCIFMFY